MPMNWIHRRLCASDRWATTVRDRLLPWALAGVDLGPDVVEVGPGYGMTTRVLAARTDRLTAVEVDPVLADRLHRTLNGAVRVVSGDGAALPLPDRAFSGAVCFTMLHHMPSPERQDRLFAEVCRVLRPGGVFAGSDGVVSLRFRLLHLADTMVPVDPGTLGPRLAAAGFVDVDVAVADGRSFRFRARRPAAGPGAAAS